MHAVLKESTRDSKKWMVILDKGRKTVHFGQDGASDYTIHKDPERKKRYIDRHKARENWKDPETSGFWSRWLLWNKPSISASKKDISKRFDIQFGRNINK